jgi:dihydroorotase-like cyclic amidohydrolase
VTAEVTPHHLAFDDSDLEAIDPSFKMMPPLRSRTDRDALRAGLRSGAIDAVATDHAPHAAHEKNVEFDAAPFGVIGLADAALLRRAMEHVGRLGGVVTQHAIDPDLAGEGHLHDGAQAKRHGIRGIPSSAETVIVERDIALVRETGATYHLQHVSCA